MEDVQLLDHVSDIRDLGDIDEEAVLRLMERRFERSLIYTRAGEEVLVSINPYQQVQVDLDEHSPHLKSLADAVYKSLAAHSPENGLTLGLQSCRGESLDLSSSIIIITGESGTGKTEATKFLFDSLLRLSGSREQDSRKTMLAGRALEVFGSASTTHNFSSSRYGKLIRLSFGPGSMLQRVDMETFLLEKTRVAGRSNQSEGNFHIFHRLFNADEATLRMLRLCNKRASDFRFLRMESAPSGGESKHVAVTDAPLDDSVEAMVEGLGMNKEEALQVIAVVAGILHLGEIDFEEDTREEQYEAAADLLGLSAQELRSGLISKSLVVGGQCIVTSLTANQSQCLRTALATELYCKMFALLVRYANSCQQASIGGELQRDGPTVCLLDMFGFEAVEYNGFEQLLINYANEKLHALFVHNKITRLREEYEGEGLPQPDVCMDSFLNADVMRSLEGKSGLFDVLHEYSVLSNHSATAREYNLSTALSQVLTTSKFNNTFVIQHFARKVTYQLEHMIERNRDGPVHVSIHSLARTSRNPMLSEAFGGSSEGVGQAPSTNDSVCRAFRKQIQGLLRSFQNSRTYFVKCFKSNDLQQPGHFDRQVVLQQLQHSGLVAASKICQFQFAHSLSHERFWSDLGPLRRYANCHSPQELLKKYLDDDQYAIGKSKYYLTSKAWVCIRNQQRQVVSSSATRCQSAWRAWAQRRRYRGLRQAMNTLRAALRRYRQRRMLYWQRVKVLAVRRIANSARRFCFYRRILRTQRCNSWTCAERGTTNATQECSQGDTEELLLQVSVSHSTDDAVCFAEETSEPTNDAECLSQGAEEDRLTATSPVTSPISSAPKSTTEKSVRTIVAKLYEVLVGSENPHQCLDALLFSVMLLMLAQCN